MTVSIRLFLCLTLMAWSGTVFAGDVLQNLGPGNVAIKGYDPVAYQSQNAAIAGSPDFTATFEGATYRFASAANRDAFQADPAKYAPAFGGYCAMGVAYGQKIDVEPTAFRVIDGKLYLNLNKAVQARWLQDIPGNLERADRNWPQIADKTPASLK
jgi:YHS domain-containing protein